MAENDIQQGLVTLDTWLQYMCSIVNTSGNSNATHIYMYRKRMLSYLKYQILNNTHTHLSEIFLRLQKIQELCIVSGQHIQVISSELSLPPWTRS